MVKVTEEMESIKNTTEFKYFQFFYQSLIKNRTKSKIASVSPLLDDTDENEEGFIGPSATTISEEDQRDNEEIFKYFKTSEKIVDYLEVKIASCGHEFCI